MLFERMDRHIYLYSSGEREKKQDFVLRERHETVQDVTVINFQYDISMLFEAISMDPESTDVYCHLVEMEEVRLLHHYSQVLLLNISSMFRREFSVSFDILHDDF